MVREALALSEQEGDFGYLTDNSKGIDTSQWNKTLLQSGTRCPLGLTPLPPLTQLLVLALALLLAAREAISLSNQEGEFVDLMEGSK